MNHHENPFDMTGPEFAGLTFDEKWELKKQLRIRDRNRMITTRRRRERHTSNFTVALWGVVLSGLLLWAYAYVVFPT